MIDLSGIEYNFLPGLLWWLVPVAIAVGYLWWMFATHREESNFWGNTGVLFFVFGVGWLIVGGTIMLVAVPSSYVANVEKTMSIEQLESQGFANVDLDSDRKFTASVDGQYFRGALVHDHEYTYQVVELAVD